MARQKITFSQISSGLLIPFLVIIIGAGGYLFVYPKYQSLGNSQETLASKRLALADRKSQLEGISKLVQEINKKSGDLIRIDQALPEAADIPQLLGNFDQLSAQSGLLVTSLRLSPAETLQALALGQEASKVKRIGEIISATEGLERIEIELTAKGFYPNLKAFLVNLEQNLRLIDIQSLILGEVDEASAIQEFQLKLQTYYQKNEPISAE